MTDHVLASEDAFVDVSSSASSASSSSSVSFSFSVGSNTDKPDNRVSFGPGTLPSGKRRRSAWKNSKTSFHQEHSLQPRRCPTEDGTSKYYFKKTMSNPFSFRFSSSLGHQFDVGDDGSDARKSIPKQFKVKEAATDYSATLRDYLKMSSHEINQIKCIHNLSITTITAISLFGYVFLVSLFGVFVYLIDTDNLCVAAGDDDEASIPFRTYYALSWHTFSTVGFGQIHPEPELSSSCAVISLTFFLESFVGVMYAGLCGALLYSRITKELDHADVLFSNGICISYCRFEDFPVLELRIVNCRANTVGGEIIDASVDCLVGLKGWASVSKNVDMGSTPGQSLAADLDSLTSLSNRSKNNRLRSLRWSKSHMQAHSNPECVTISQPVCRYFSRIWSVKHTLDENSSLLLPGTKSRIKESNGKWPVDLLNKEKIVESLVPFKEIIVTIRGTSVETGRPVFSCKTYGLANIFSGYKFADMLSEDCSDGKIKVDFKLLSDIIEEAEFFDDDPVY